MDFSRDQFQLRLNAKVADGLLASGAFYGLREVSVVIDGELNKSSMMQFLDIVFIRQPHYTGWPPWVNSRGFRDTDSHPYITMAGCEAFILSSMNSSKDREVDFWRMEPAGRFYHLRTYEDDTSRSLIDRGVKPGTLLDFLLLISRTAEILGTVKSFAESLGCRSLDGHLELVFRWSGLKGREICCWVEPSRSLYGSKAVDDVVVSKHTLLMDTPDNAIWSAVKKITQPVFDVFGTAVDDSVIQEITNRTFDRSV